GVDRDVLRSVRHLLLPPWNLDLPRFAGTSTIRRISVSVVSEEASVDATVPSAGPFDLRWRVFGTSFRVKPSFWIANLLFGYFYVTAFRRAEERLFAYLGLWLLCAFVSILLHELGHVIVARIFGASSNVVLHAMGGLAIGAF